MGWVKRLFAAEGGSILVMAALALTAVMGMSGMAVEVGTGYTAKVRNQRIADMAALGAALAYKNGSQDPQAAIQVAKDIAVASGLPANAATVTVPVTIGTTSAVQVQIQTSVQIKMASLLTSDASYKVTTVAAASLGTSNSSGCITALGTSSTAVSATGGASITASGCAINTNGTVYSSNGSAKITAKQITAQAISDAAASYNQNAVTTTPTAHNITTKANGASDPVSSNASVQQALCYVNLLNGTTDSDYAGGNISCSSPLVTSTSPGTSGSSTDVTFTSGTAAAGYAANFNSGTATYTLPDGNYTFRNVTINGGVTVKFGNSNVRADSINDGGSLMTVGNGSLIVTNTFNYGTGTVTIGNGIHYFGTLTVCGGCTLTIGSGNFTVQNALTESGGSYIKIGISTGDAVTISNSLGATNAIDVAGGSYLCFTPSCAAPTAAAGTFSVNGTVATSGGSTLITPNAATHVIKGSLSLNGSSTLGSGLYVIGGSFTNNTGGTMTGDNVTFALGGTFNLAGGTTLDLAAPDAASGYGITDILVVTKTTSATTIGGGSADKYSGLFYAPKSDMSLSGGSSISTNGSACMMVVVKSVAASGSGTLNTSACASQSNGAGNNVALIK